MSEIFPRPDQLVELLADCEVSAAIAELPIQMLKADLDRLAAELREAVSNEFEAEDDCRRVVAAIGRLPADATVGAEAADATVTLPEQVGPYRILGLIGRGGMGVVCRALHADLDKIVAIKLLPKPATDNSRAVRRFKRELRAAGRVQHPHIVTIHDGGESEGMHYLVMECIDGIDVNALAEHEPLTIADACEIVRQAALGLEHVAQQGLVHRDVKPSNLMLTADAEGRPIVKVLDLGLARLEVLGADATDSSLEGSVVGTIDYMAPEQAVDSNVDVRADVYSLGATLCKLLTGRPPFDRQKGLARTLMTITLETAPSIGTRRSDLPSELVELVDQMLARDPALRPSRPGDVARRLAPFATGQQLKRLLGARVTTPGSPNGRTLDGSRYDTSREASVGEREVPTAKPVRWQMSRLVASLLVLVCLATAGFMTNAWWRRERPELVVRPDATTNTKSVTPDVTVTPPPVEPPVVPSTPEPPAVVWEPGDPVGIPGGLIARPAKLPGVATWQVFTKAPRGGVNVLEWSPNGRWLAALVEAEQSVRVYESDSSRLARLVPLRGPLCSGRMLAWHPDSDRLALGGDAGVSVLSVSDGRVTPVTSRRPRTNLAWSPDGKSLAFGEGNSLWRVRWNDDGAVEESSWGQHAGAVAMVGWSSDSQWLASTDFRELRLVRADDAATTPPEFDAAKATVLSRSKGGMLVFAWHPSEPKLLAGRDDGVFAILKPDGTEEFRHTFESGVTLAEWRPDGVEVAIVTRDENVWRCSPPNGVRLFRKTPGSPIESHHDPRTNLRTNPLRWNRRGELVLRTKWDLWLSRFDRELRSHFALRTVAWRPSDWQFATGSCVPFDSLSDGEPHGVNGVIRLWNADGTPVRNLTDEAPKAFSLSLNPRDGRIATASRDGSVRVWQADGRQERSLRGLTWYPGGTAWHPDGELLAAVDRNGVVVVWNSAGVEVARIVGVTIDFGVGAFNAQLAFDGSGDRLAVAGRNGVALFDWRAPPKDIGSLPIHRGSWWGSMAFSPDGSLIAASSYFGGSRLTLWQADGTQRREVRLDETASQSLAWSPDGTRVAIGGHLGVRLVTPDGETGPAFGSGIVYGLAWSPDGEFLATTSPARDGLRLWRRRGDTAEPADDLQLADPLRDAYSVAFTRDRLLAAGKSGIAVWDWKARRLDRLIVPLPRDETAVFSEAGELLWSTAGAESELVYVTTDDEGRYGVLTPAEFRSRVERGGPR